ncbi:hypothetical protein D8674_013466 [Pyrus ussuriensis x Pyrus communis]|uniref:Uncharacterized protein n=1 Tax=Pyrus ussuriensis x Pyrus communis TaxID=2448454 RepID=A0A5N5GR37_9ROSA|nr:hypothetical protein D8674_013466 [Pyrus ussuriensis x Pyrus communis]
MNSTASIAKLSKRISDSVDFVEIDHSCSTRFRNHIKYGISRFLIILDSLQSKD